MTDPASPGRISQLIADRGFIKKILDQAVYDANIKRLEDSITLLDYHIRQLSIICSTILAQIFIENETDEDLDHLKTMLKEFNLAPIPAKPPESAERREFQ
jgi:hypothetical protein